MPAEKYSTTAGHDWPQSRSELDEWIEKRLSLSPDERRALQQAIDGVFDRHQRLWQESKDDAIQALSVGFANKLAKLRSELSERDAAVSSIANYFEDLVAGLTDKTHRDPKTKLMNFDWFMEQLESYLELEQRVRWCAVGLVDITAFKWYNDALGHPVGDRIIERVAHLLSEQIRSDDLIAQERGFRPAARDLHARFGGDEFCFLIPDLGGVREAHAVADRFKEAVEGYDWTLVDPGLAEQPVRVDVGVVCLWMGRVAERRFAAKQLALDLIQQADKLMYDAKGDRAGHVYVVEMKVVDGQLAEAGQERPRPGPRESAVDLAAFKPHAAS
ncbi:MAG: GGDEF domain-containing protein [Bacteroidales bacterium]